MHSSFIDYLAIIATAAGTLSCLSYLLQARRMLHTGGARDISLTMLWSAMLSYGVWFVYAAGIHNTPLLVVDGVGLLTSGSALCVALTLRYDLRARLKTTWTRARARLVGVADDVRHVTGEFAAVSSDTAEHPLPA